MIEIPNICRKKQTKKKKSDHEQATHNNPNCNNIENRKDNEYILPFI